MPRIVQDMRDNVQLPTLDTFLPTHRVDLVSTSRARSYLAHLVAHYCRNPPGMSQTSWTTYQTEEHVKGLVFTIWTLYRRLLIRRFWVQVPDGVPDKRIRTPDLERSDS